MLRTRLHLPNVSQVGRSLVAPNVFSLTREDGRTRVRMTASWEGLKRSPIASGLVASLLGGTPALGVQGAFETILEIAEAHRVGPRTRVELENEVLDEDEAPPIARKAARR